MVYIMVKCLDKVHPDTLMRCHARERIEFFDSLGYHDRETGEFVDLGQRMRQMYPNSMIARVAPHS